MDFIDEVEGDIDLVIIRPADGGDGSDIEQLKDDSDIEQHTRSRNYAT